MHMERTYVVIIEPAYGHPGTTRVIRSTNADLAKWEAIYSHGEETGLESRDIRATVSRYEDIPI